MREHTREKNSVFEQNWTPVGVSAKVSRQHISMLNA